MATPEYYRNKLDIISFERIYVEQDSLWERRGDLMVLVDEDQYVTYPFEEDKFFKVIP